MPKAHWYHNRVPYNSVVDIAYHFEYKYQYTHVSYFTGSKRKPKLQTTRIMVTWSLWARFQSSICPFHPILIPHLPATMKSTKPRLLIILYFIKKEMALRAQFPFADYNLSLISYWLIIPYNEGCVQIVRNIIHIYTHVYLISLYYTYRRFEILILRLNKFKSNSVIFSVLHSVIVLICSVCNTSEACASYFSR